jgi:TetR/AcrR family transcriptional regulator, cholesterol catabolism regulator
MVIFDWSIVESEAGMDEVNEGQLTQRRLGRRERKKLEVEQRIRTAALELFSGKGYEATTVEEIAERADVAKGTFFNYFPRKDALLEAIAEDMVGGFLDELGPEESWEGSIRDQMLRLFTGLGDLIARDPELTKVMMIENLRSLWLRREDPLEQEFRELMHRLLGRAIERGEIESAADVALGAKLIEAAYFTTMVDWMRRGAPGDAYRHEMQVKFDIIFRGLGMSPRVRG